MRRIRLEKIHNTPALWEKGGGGVSAGTAVIIADSNGAPKQPMNTRSMGVRHALFRIEPGDHIIKANHRNLYFNIKVYRVERIITGTNHNLYAEVSLVSKYRMGKWSPPLPTYLEAAADAAVKKATCSHCSAAHYADTAPRTDVCIWEEDEGGNWWTSCGRAFIFISGGSPAEDRFAYCPYCGQPLEDRSGLPAPREKSGGWSNTGSAVIVAGPAGEKKRPVNIRRRGHLAGGEHALLDEAIAVLRRVGWEEAVAREWVEKHRYWYD